jgi:hypothetical protein
MTRRARTVSVAVVAAAVLAVAGVAVASGGGRTQSSAAATTQWADANSDQFSQGVTTLLRDAKWVHQAIAGHDAPAAVRTYCDYLFLDAEGENTDLLPTPDHQLTSLLSASYDGFVQAAADCDEHSTSASVLARVDDERGRSVSELVEAVLREEAVTGTSLGITGIP